jgi:hypothetical protein
VEGREYPLFAVGVGLAILHVLDDTFVGRQGARRSVTSSSPASSS